MTMSNETLELQDTPEQVLEPQEPVEAAPVVEPVLEPEMTHRYQPTDDLGRPLGGQQVIKYRTQAELLEKFQEQNMLLIRKLRSETRKNRLGIVEDEEISAESQRFEEPVSFTPRHLSPEERVILSRDLLDPDRFDEAASTLFEATLGTKPEVLRNQLSRTQDTLLKMQAKTESDAFVANNVGYVKCQENFEAITNWMIRYNLAPVRENFQRAYDTLRAANILVEHQAPAPVEVVPIQVEPVAQVQVDAVVPEPVAVPTGPVQRIATGLNRNTATDVGPVHNAANDITYEVLERDGRGQVTGAKKVFKGIAAINAMPSDEYKRRLMSDRSFSKKVEQLENEAEKRRRA
jgi:hypothetical protein